MPVAARTTRPIEDYALIGDMQTAALVSRDGAIDWFCVPRFDSPACFAAILGDERHGYWRISPRGGDTCTRRRYREDTMILETEWETAEGTVRVTDLMPPRDEAVDIVRVIEGVRGRVPMVMDLRVRFDYGSVLPRIISDHGETTALAGPDAVVLHTSLPVTVRDGDVTAEVEVSTGDRIELVLTYHPSHLPAPRPVSATQSLARTESFWREWASRITYDGPWSEAVRRSVLTLKALTDAPTGGICAAPTTSLPEDIGGSRNWDYRFCWLRDATFTLQALLGTGYVEEAKAWREWLLRAVAGDPADLQIMYGIDGRRWIPELEVGWLPGYAGSSPVRVGNGAADQLQLDVWGEVLDCLSLARDSGLTLNEDTWALQRSMLDFLEGHWSDLDNGLWEVRGPRRAFVHSRVMTWAGVDRGIRAVTEYGLPGPVDRWRALAAQIHDDVCRRGFDSRRNTFTQFYGSDGLDAALLLIGRVGFLPWDDPRVVGTVEAVQQELSHEGFLLRYHTHADDRVDGLPGSEGAFLICSFWLVEALHGIGRQQEAVDLFERLLQVRNDVGLLSEEYDPVSGRHLGNTPQAFSHLGLVNAALRLQGTADRGQVR